MRISLHGFLSAFSNSKAHVYFSPDSEVSGTQTPESCAVALGMAIAVILEPEMRYGAELTAGGLKVRESRVVADLLLRSVDEAGWRQAIYAENVLQARSPKTAKRLSVLIRGRLTTVEAPLWKLIQDGSSIEATHACLAAAVKASYLLGDFLDIALRDQYRTFKETLAVTVWTDFLDDCRGRDPAMPQWTDSTITRLRSSVYTILAEVGYIDSTKTRKLQRVHLVKPVLRYLEQHNEDYVLRCIQVGT